MVKLYKEWGGKPCHLYRHERFHWKRYIPVSTLKKLFEEPFDTEKIALGASRRPHHPVYGENRWLGMAVEDIKQAWADNAETERNLGTAIHLVFENHTLSGGSWKGETEMEQTIIANYCKVKKELDFCDLSLEVERVLWLDIRSMDGKWTSKNLMDISEDRVAEVIHAMLETGRCTESYTVLMNKYKKSPTEFSQYAKDILLDVGIAGTCDMLQEYLEGFKIGDIKTDKDIKRKAFRRGEMMLGILAHLNNCNYEQYAIQIEFYALMFERWCLAEYGYMKPYWGGTILHTDKKTYGVTLITLERRRTEVNNIIKYVFFETDKFKELIVYS
jgi:hypothetical protein